MVGQLSVPRWPWSATVGQPTVNGRLVSHSCGNGIPCIRDDISSSTDEQESLWIELQNNNSKNILCAVVYRHPNSDLVTFFESFFKTLEKAHAESKYCIIMGDFNINLLNSESHSQTEHFINNLASYFFQPHILHPTRITSHSATLIDNIFFNSLDHNTISGNILCDLSDHLPNFLLINEIDITREEDTYIRDYSNLDERIFIEKFEQIDWDETFQGMNDVNQIFGTFYSTATNIIDQHIPLRKLSRRERKLRSKPWITPALKVSIGIKNKLFRKYIKSRNEYPLLNYACMHAEESGMHAEEFACMHLHCACMHMHACTMSVHACKFLSLQLH